MPVAYPACDGGGVINPLFEAVDIYIVVADTVHFRKPHTDTPV
jgi:hypothetical protein